MRAVCSTNFARQVASVACLLFLAAGISGEAFAQPKRFRPQPQYVQLREPDQAEGRRILEDFRLRGTEGDYYWEFSLRVMPKRGEERTIPGRLWGSRNERGPITRIALWPGVAATERRLLVQNGPQSAVWSWSASDKGGVGAMGSAALFEALGGTDLTSFDLQMPFIYWSDFVFEGVTNLRQRPAHVFLLYPPADVAAQRPELAGVRVYLDTAYHALLQAEQIGVDGKRAKTMTVTGVIKVDDRYIVKSVDLRDEATRNKTRFTVTGAAMGIELPKRVFEPGTLEEAIRPPAADRVRVVAP